MFVKVLFWECWTAVCQCNYWVGCTRAVYKWSRWRQFSCSLPWIKTVSTMTHTRGMVLDEHSFIAKSTLFFHCTRRNYQGRSDIRFNLPSFWIPFNISWALVIQERLVYWNMSNVNRLLILITGFLPGFLAWLMWLQAVCQLLAWKSIQQPHRQQWLPLGLYACRCGTKKRADHWFVWSPPDLTTTWLQNCNVFGIRLHTW